MAEQETLIYIDENDKQEASINARNFAKEDIQNRAYYNTLGAQLIKKFLASENVNVANTYSIHSIKKILEELDIADIMLGNIHIDIRVVFNENFIFIPKSHFKYEILPDIYLVLLMSNDKKYVKFLGFFEPKLINTNNQNDEYYFIEKEKLTPPANLKEYIQNCQNNTDQDLSETELDISDMQILSLIDYDINEQDKKQLLKNLVKSAKLRDRFIEFENFEVISYNAEHSPDVIKPEVPTFPSIEVAAAATAEALEQLDFGGSANTQELPNENEIINGFNALERNIPDLTPEDNSVADEISSDGNIIDELPGITDMENQNLDETPEQQNIAPSDFENEINQNETDETKTQQPSQEIQEDILDNSGIDDFNEIKENELLEETANPEAEISTIDETPDTQTGIIEQQNTQETINFDEIMPLEINTDIDSTALSQEDPSADMKDFNEPEPMAESKTSTEASSTENSFSETINFDDITADIASSETEDTISNPEIIEPKQELEDLDNLVLDSSLETEETTEKEILNTAEEFTAEPTIDLEEPLQELSFDEENLSLEEPLLDISENITKDTAAKPVKEDVSQSSDNTADLTMLDDFENLVFEDEKAHGIDNKNLEMPTGQTPELSNILQEDIELDKMLESENLIQPQEMSDELITFEELSGSNKASETHASRGGQPFNMEFLASTEDNITDLNLNADEIEKSIVTDDIAGVEGLTEPQNNTDLSADDLLSQIDDLLGTEDGYEEQPKDDISKSGDKLGMLFNNSENADAGNVISEFDDGEEDLESQNHQQSNFATEKGKKAIIAAAAVVAVLAVAGGAGLFLKSKNSSDLLAQNPIESDTANIPAPIDKDDNTNLMTNAPDLNTQASDQNAKTAESAKPANKPSKPAKSKQSDAKTKTSSPAEASSASPAPSGTPLPYITVRSVAWEVPDYLSYSDKIKKYLQTAGKSIRLTLASDLLLTNEYAYSNQVKVELKLKNDGTLQDAQIIKSSGSTQINDIVLRTVKDTLKVVKPASGEVPTPDFKLGLIINL